MISYTFPKTEKLCSDRLIRLLYETGKTFVEFPFRVKTLSVGDLSIKNIRVLISAPVKNFKNASTRNLIKRRIREAYRLNKGILLNNAKLNLVPINPSTFQLINPTKDQLINKQTITLLIGIYYIAKEVLDFEMIQKKLIIVLENIKNHDFIPIDHTN